MQWSKLRIIAAKYGIIAVLIALIALFSLTTDVFLTPINLFNILRQVAVIGIVAAGMTFVIITAGIDLSVGSLIGVSGVVAAKLMVDANWPVFPSLLVTLVICTLIGLFNGFLINKVHIPPLIATLGMMTLLRGVAYTITAGLPVYGFSGNFRLLGQGYIWLIPIPVIIMVVVFIGGYIVLEKTSLGRYIYGIGGNEEATRLSGVNIEKVKYIAYSLSGFLSGLAGIVLLSRINSGQPIAGTGYELEIITAVLLGGVSIMGGEGKIAMVIVGVVIMGVLSNGMILLDMQQYIQWIVKGAVLLAAVGFDRFVSHRAGKI